MVLRLAKTRLSPMKSVCVHSQRSYLTKRFDNFPSDWVDAQKVYREMRSYFSFKYKQVLYDMRSLVYCLLFLEKS